MRASTQTLPHARWLTKALNFAGKRLTRLRWGGRLGIGRHVGGEKICGAAVVGLGGVEFGLPAEGAI